MWEENRKLYYRLIKEQTEQFEKGYEEYCRKCEENFGTNGCQCDELASYAYLKYAQYRYTGEKSYARAAADALVRMGMLSDKYLEQEKRVERDASARYTIRQAVLTSGRLPEAPMEQMFLPTYYMLTYQGLAKEGFLNSEEKGYCERAVFRAINPLFEYTDWGPHNRGIIKGTNLMMAGVCFPEADRAEESRKLGEILCAESIGKWSIEDAQVYIPIWLNELIIYHEVCGGTEYYDNSMVKFYFDFIVKLMAPDANMPEFGDGRFLNSAEAFISCLEKGGAVYRDGKMRYAAGMVARNLCSLMSPYASSPNNMCFLASALIWSDESIGPVPFRLESCEVPDDLVGKKYRFCSGEGDDCLYMLFNYRDEGDYARRVRGYMRSTLVVEKEKMHHGHSDENSIVLLTAGNSILLRDGGYREMDGGERLLKGAYRSDFYHNKLLVRCGKPEEGEGFLDFCSAEPDYCPVRTEKIYFETFAHCDTARTKLTDEKHSVECDRMICYDKDNGFYLVVDTVKALEDGEYTFGPVFFGQDLEQKADGGYLSYRETACDQPFERTFENGHDYRLRVAFPQKEFAVGKQEIRRSYHQENGLYQLFSGRLKKGQIVSQVSLLQPVRTDGSTREVKVTEVRCLPEGLSVEICADGKTHVYAFRYELTAEHGIGLRRPEYTFEGSAVHYGKLYTDALFSHIAENDGTDYEVLSFTRIEYDGKLMWQVPASSLIQGDWTLAEEVSEWNKWYGTVK